MGLLGTQPFRQLLIRDGRGGRDRGGTEKKQLRRLGARSGFPLKRLLFSGSAVSDSLQPHKLQHVRLTCPSPSPGVCSNSCPLRWGCHPTILSSLPPSPPALNLSQHQALFQTNGPSIRASALASVLLMNIQA